MAATRSKRKLNNVSSLPPAKRSRNGAANLTTLLVIATERNAFCHWHFLPPELTTAVHARLGLADLWRLSQTCRSDRLTAWSTLDRKYELGLGFPSLSFFQPDILEIRLRGLFALCGKGFDPLRVANDVWATIWDVERGKPNARRIRERFKILARLTSLFATIHSSGDFARSSVVMLQKIICNFSAAKAATTVAVNISDLKELYLYSIGQTLDAFCARLQHPSPSQPRCRSLAAITSLFTHLETSHTLSLLPYVTFELFLTTLCTHALPGTDTDTLRTKIRILGSVRDTLVKVAVRDSDMPVARRIMSYTLREVMRALRMFKLRMCEYMMQNAEVIRQVFWLSPGGKGKEKHLEKLDNIVSFEKLCEYTHNADTDPAEHFAIARCQRDWRSLMEEASRGVGPDRAALWGEERVTREGARFLKGLEEYVLA